MGTARAIRQLKPDPVPPELIDKLLWAATRAPSPGTDANFGPVNRRPVEEFVHRNGWEGDKRGLGERA